jgi:hypothetical protein
MMMRDEKNIDRLFRDNLGDFEVDVPIYTWDNIKHELQFKRKRRMMIFIRSLAALVVILLSFATGYFLSDFQSENKVVYEMVRPNPTNFVKNHQNYNSGQKRNTHFPVQVENNRLTDKNITFTKNEEKKSQLQDSKNSDPEVTDKNYRFAKQEAKKLALHDAKNSDKEANKSQSNKYKTKSAKENQGKYDKNKTITSGNNSKEAFAFNHSKAQTKKLKDKSLNINKEQENEIAAITGSPIKNRVKQSGSIRDNDANVMADMNPKIAKNKNHKEKTSYNNSSENELAEAKQNIIKNINEPKELANSVSENEIGMNQTVLSTTTQDNQVAVVQGIQLSSQFAQVMSESESGGGNQGGNGNGTWLLIPNYAHYSTSDPQNEKPQDLLLATNQKKNWVIGGQVSPVYAFNSNGLNKSEEMYSNVVVKQNSIDPKATAESKKTAALSYSGGLNIYYSFGKRLSLQSGVYYAKREQEIENIPVERIAKRSGITYIANASSVNVNFDDLANSSLDGMRESMYDGRFEPAYDVALIANPSKTIYKLGLNLQQRFEYLEVPLILRYKLIDRKVDLNVLSGINTGFLISNSANIDAEGKNVWTGQTQNVNLMTYSASLGLGMEYGLTKALSLSVEPTMKYLLNRISDNEEVFDYPVAFNFFVGVSYRF